MPTVAAGPFRNGSNAPPPDMEHRTEAPLRPIAGRGTLRGIATRSAPRASMDEVTAASITTESGVDRDTRGKPGRRQVTVMTCNSWEAACSTLGTGPLPWTTRRANLLVEGIELKGKIGYDLRVGDAVLTITGETRPCGRMDEAHPGLMAALRPDWRGGVTSRVTRAGNVAVGCEVVLSRNIVRQLSWLTYIHGRRIFRRAQGALRGLVHGTLGAIVSKDREGKDASGRGDRHDRGAESEG